MTRPRQLFFDTVDTGNEEVRQEQVLDTVPEPEPVTEPKPMELLSVQETHHSRGKEKLKEMGFDAKKPCYFQRFSNQNSNIKVYKSMTKPHYLTAEGLERLKKS